MFYDFCTMNKLYKILPLLFPVIFCLHACTTVDLYERTVSIPAHSWKNSYRPNFDFDIRDTNTAYQFYLILRHNEKYKYNNIYINLYIKPPGNDSTQKIQLPLTLANNDGWLGSGMDDIYEHRIPLGEKQTLKAGTYQFTVEQIMRDDPLDNVFNVGLRIEKKPI
jgi:gliding motility-associated lipoprotein GldH